MYELVEEATKVLREPTDEFDFENPPEDPKEVEKNLAEAMERFGGIGLSAIRIGGGAGCHFRRCLPPQAERPLREKGTAIS